MDGVRSGEARTKSIGIFFFFFFLRSPNIALRSSASLDAAGACAIISWAVVGPRSTLSPAMVVESMVSGAGLVGSASGAKGILDENDILLLSLLQRGVKKWFSAGHGGGGGE